MWKSEIQMGIEDPKTMPQSTDEMRKLIFEASRHSALIHRALMVADIQGMNAEDKYTTLAYHSLVALEAQYKLAKRLVGCIPTPSILAATGDGGLPFSANGER